MFHWVQGYYFHTNNPYKDWPNAFEEGLQKAREGDLNTAVLLLESAILQDPQDSEVLHSRRHVRNTSHGLLQYPVPTPLDLHHQAQTV